jgi:DNA-binding LytR/AlgR family response regulator
MKILIVEDELILAYTLEGMLKSMGHDDIMVEPVFDNARTLLTHRNIGLAVLDIHLGKGKEGFELAEICSTKKIPFLYTTSYTDKATVDKAIATNPGAYLVKPVIETHLYTGVQIALNQHKSGPGHILEFKDGTSVIRLALHEVLYLRSENVYVNVTTKSRTYLFRGSLASLMQKVPDGSFIQTHRAYAVNPDYVTRVSAAYLMIGEIEIPLSRNFRQQIR